MGLTLVLGALVIIVAASQVAPRLKMPAPILLLGVGIGLSYLPMLPEIELNPKIILGVILPLLLYSAATQVSLDDFGRNIAIISGLAVALVVISSVMVGIILAALVPGLGLAGGIAMGAIVSPTDAVAATSIGKKVGLPPRLMTVLEGESLVNDASALVLLRAAIGGLAGTISLWHVAGSLVYSVAVASLVGLLVGVPLGGQVRRRIRGTVDNAIISLVAPFLAFMLAEALEASGVLAVVVAALLGERAKSSRVSAGVRTWERINFASIQYVLENGVFLLMGYEIVPLINASRVDPDMGIKEVLIISLIVVLVLEVLRVTLVIPFIRIIGFLEQRTVKRVLPRMKWIEQMLADRYDIHSVEDLRAVGLPPRPTQEQIQKRLAELGGRRQPYELPAGLDRSTMRRNRKRLRHETRRIRRRVNRIAHEARRDRARGRRPDASMIRKRGEKMILRMRRGRADLEFRRRESLSTPAGIVVSWAGMRGVVTLAAAQTLPRDMPFRAHMILVAFIVAVLMLLLHSLTLPWVIRKSGVATQSENDQNAAFSRLDRKVRTAGQRRLTGTVRSSDGNELDPSAVSAAKALLAGLEWGGSTAGEDANGNSQWRRDLFEACLLGVQAEREQFLRSRRTKEHPSHVVTEIERLLDLEETYFYEQLERP